MKESDIRKQIRDYLRWSGWYVYYNLQGLGSYPGLSDLVAIKNGRVIHIEIKALKGMQSEKQIAFQQHIKAAGGEYLVARSVDDVRHLGK